MDVSTENIKYCKEQGLNCVQSDAMEFLNVHKREYDVIIFNDVIEHFTKEEMYEILIGMKSALKENGKLLIKTYNMSNPFTGLSGRYMDLTHEIGFTEKTFYQVLYSLDFRHVNVVGADIYVFGGPIGIICRLISKIIYFLWYMCCCLAGRSSIKIFEKNIICIAEK